MSSPQPGHRSRASRSHAPNTRCGSPNASAVENTAPYPPQGSRAELQPGRGPATGEVAQRQQQPRPWIATERHHRDPLARDTALLVEDVADAIRQRKIEPRRPHGRAKPEGIAEMARRKTVRQRQPVQPAR